MYFITIAFLAAPVVWPIAAPVTAAVLSQTDDPPPPPPPRPADSHPPFPHPPIYEETPGQAFYLTVESNNPLNNGHNVQLRPVPGSKTFQHVTVDNNSTVLLSSLSSGELFSQMRDHKSQPHDSGLQGFYRNISTTDTHALQEIYFDRFAGWDRPFSSWYIMSSGSTTRFFLGHEVETHAEGQGFVICKKFDYYQLFYRVLPGNITGNCERIRLEATIVPKPEETA